jgi:hypothetical protein
MEHFKTSKYNSLSECKQANPKDYERARYMKVLGDISDHYGWPKIRDKKPNGYWTKEKCFEEARKHTTIKDWALASGSSYNKSKRNGWVSECTAHMVKLQKPKGFWNNKERCIEDAKKYTTKTDWQKNSRSYDISKKYGWYDECCEHMVKLQKPRNYWTKERCFEEAKNYNTKAEWKTGSGSSYYASRKQGWHEECIKHMRKSKRPNGYWNNKERCIESAKKFNTKFEWSKNEGGAYNAANRNGYIDECTKHMK